MGIDMKNKINRLLSIPDAEKKSIALDFDLLKVTVPILLLGQAVQHHELFDPEYIDQFWRHHLANCVDAVGLASLFNIYSSAVIKKSMPALFAIAAVATGAGYEWIQAQDPDRVYDYVDLSIYALSAAMYCIIHNEDKLANDEGPLIYQSSRSYSILNQLTKPFTIG